MVYLRPIESLFRRHFDLPSFHKTAWKKDPGQTQKYRQHAAYPGCWKGIPDQGCRIIEQGVQAHREEQIPGPDIHPSEYQTQEKLDQ